MPSGATVFLMCWKMRWTTTNEQHCSLQVVGSRKFLRKARTKKKSTAQEHVASTAPLLHPQSKNFSRRTTQRQQRQLQKEKKKKKKRSNLFRVLPIRTVRGQDRSWVADSVDGYYGQRVTRKEFRHFHFASFADLAYMPEYKSLLETLTVVSSLLALCFTHLQTIRITRTLIRDNTHDLNNTRGHTTRGTSGTMCHIALPQPLEQYLFPIVLPIFGTLFPTNYKKQVLLIVFKGST